MASRKTDFLGGKDIFNAAKKIHFLCIGGFSMCALARVLAKNNEVSGTDLRVKNIPGCKVYAQDDQIHFSPDLDYLIYNTVTPLDNVEYKYCKENNIPILHRTELLELITKNRFKIAITGCSGKTSTSYYISNLIPSSFAFIGEHIYADPEGDYISYREGDGPYVVELNEADMKFCEETADILVFKNYGIDHIWLFKDESEIQDYYLRLFDNCKHVIYRDEIDLIKRAKEYCKHTEFHQVSYEILNTTNDWQSFTQSTEFKFQDEIYHTSLYGTHSIHNLCDAMYATNLYKKIHNLPITKFDLSCIKHCNRRTDILYQSPEKVIIDDQALFYTEIQNLIDNMKVFGQPISIIVCDVYKSNKRTDQFLQEYIKIMQNNRSASYRPEIKPQFLLKDDNDLFEFLDNSQGIVLVMHKLYEDLLATIKRYSRERII